MAIDAADRSWIERNAQARRDLEAVLSRLRAEDGARVVETGWTVTGALGHLAFWDRLGLQRLDVLEASGELLGTIGGGFTADHVNAAGRDDWNALPLDVARRNLLAAAEAIDGRIAGLTEEAVRTVLDAGRLNALDRSRHRGEHLDQIRQVCGL